MENKAENTKLVHYGYGEITVLREVSNFKNVMELVWFVQAKCDGIVFYGNSWQPEILVGTPNRGHIKSPLRPKVASKTVEVYDHQSYTSWFAQVRQCILFEIKIGNGESSWYLGAER